MSWLGWGAASGGLLVAVDRGATVFGLQLPVRGDRVPPEDKQWGQALKSSVARFSLNGPDGQCILGYCCLSVRQRNTRRCAETYNVEHGIC